MLLDDFIQGFKNEHPDIDYKCLILLALTPEPDSSCILHAEGEDGMNLLVNVFTRVMLMSPPEHVKADMKHIVREMLKQLKERDL